MREFGGKEVLLRNLEQQLPQRRRSLRKSRSPEEMLPLHSGTATTGVPTTATATATAWGTTACDFQKKIGIYYFWALVYMSYIKKEKVSLKPVRLGPLA